MKTKLAFENSLYLKSDCKFVQLAMPNKKNLFSSEVCTQVRELLCKYPKTASKTFHGFLPTTAILSIALLVAMAVTNLQGDTLYWDANGDTAGTGGNGNWDTTSSFWRVDSDTGALGTWTNTGSNNDAVLAGTTGTATLTANISVNDITANQDPSGTYAIAGAQTLTLNGTAQSVLTVASGSTLTITSGLAGVNGFTKNSAGTLILDGAGGTNGLLGAITLNSGTLQAGSATNNGASQVLRSSAVNLASGTSLTTVGTTIDLRVGSLSGTGSVTPATGGAINIQSLQDATFSGAITTTGGLNLRGGNGTIQTFNGNLTGLTGTIAINSGATLKLTGTATNAGVLGSVALATRGGTISLDNSGGNAAGATGRIADTAALTVLGGKLELIGNSAGTAETVGGYTMNVGQNTITVNNGGGTGAALTLASFTRTSGNAGTVNFVGTGTGALGAAGNNSRVIFTTAPGLTNNVIANSNSSGILGFATVNGTDFAGYGANGVVAVSSTAVSGALATAATQNSVLTANGSTIAASNVGYNTLKIAPTSSGFTLDLTGAGALNTAGILLAGNNDFTIRNTGTGTGGLIAANQRFVHVANAGTTLSVGVSLVSSNNAFTKSGVGILALTGTSTQVGGTTATKFGIAGGVLRGSLTSLGSGAASGGVFSTIQLRGGVLEISGGGTLTRAIDLASTASGGSITFDEGASDRGDGGFSAISGNATVTLVTAIGGSTAASLVWNDGAFLSNGYVLTMGSTKADSVITLSNNIGLDSTATAGGAANNYFAREIRVADNTGSANDVARLSGVISGSANADLLKTGSGVLELTGTNTSTGNALIQQGTLIATNGAAIANTSAVILSNTAGATFQLNNSETIGALSGGGTTGGNVNIQGNALTVGDQRDSTFGGIISGSGGSLSKQGTGILSLTNTSTYSGSTSVSEGSLFLNGSLANTSSTSVSANATLAANGTIANNVSIASSGIMAIGADDAISTVGSVTVGSLGLSGSLEFGASAALTYDKLISTGALAVTSGTIAFKTSGYTVDYNTSFDIVDFVSFTGTPTFDFSGASVKQYGAWDTSAFATSGVISYVPEPSSSMLLGASGALALLRRRR